MPREVEYLRLQAAIARSALGRSCGEARQHASAAKHPRNIVRWLGVPATVGLGVGLVGVVCYCIARPRRPRCEPSSATNPPPSRASLAQRLRGLASMISTVLLYLR
jgi:hypothetical protein